jgi:probable HAF family extracellular repeat protein
MKKILALALLIFSTASHAVSYNIQMLESLSSGSESTARGISETGMVVGSSVNATGDREAVYWDNGIAQSLGFNGTAYAVNSNGTIVGESVTFVHAFAGELGRAFKWENGVVTDLGDLNGSYAGARDINENGLITGNSFTIYDASGVTGLHGFKWDNGVMSDLGTVSVPTGYSRGEGINDLGEIAGRASLVEFGGSEKHLAYWEADGTLHSIVGPGAYSTAQDINNNGIIVGNARQPGMSDQYAMIVDENGVIRLLGTLGGNQTRLHAINDADVAVGSSRTGTTSSTDQAMIVYDGDNVINLNDEVIDMTGWETLSAAYDINGSGQIIGTGIRTTGEQAAFLLNPVPVPAAVWLFASALGLLGWTRRRRNAKLS